MFERATKQLVRQIDPNGVLIPARLNDSKNLKLLAVVLKKPKVWFWQKAKYRPTCFTLNDLLKTAQINPVRDEKDFLKFEATYKSALSGSMEVGNEAVGLNVKGQGRSKMRLSLDTLKKEDMDIPKLLKDSQKTKVDLKHSLIQQSSKMNWIFTLLKERIFTTCECSISYTGMEQASCSALGRYSEMVLTKENGELQYDSDVALNIPPGTVMAYSVIEMSFSQDGSLKFYVEPDGIEADDISQHLGYSEVDGHLRLKEIQEEFSFCSFQKEFQTRFCVLSNLSPECRLSLLSILRKILLDRQVLSVLVDWLEILNSGEMILLSEKKLLENQSHLIGEVLDLLKSESHNRSGITTASVTNQNGSHISATHHGKQILMAMHMLLSAIEEMTDDGLQMLESFCFPEGLKNLHGLVNLLMGNLKPLSEHAIPVFLKNEDEFKRVVKLFKSCNVSLKGENDMIFQEICEKGFLPIVLCIAVSGLACLIDSK